MSQYLEHDVGLFEGLRALSLAHHSLPHRLYYAARHVRSPGRWSRMARTEPVFWFWRMALEVLVHRRRLSGSELLALLADFDRTHQPLPR